MRESRGKKKFTTVVQGIASYGEWPVASSISRSCHFISLSSPFHVFESVAGIDPKVASKFFGGRFACGSSVTGDDEIVIQGDVGDDLYDVIPEKWPEVSDVTVRFHA